MPKIFRIPRITFPKIKRISQFSTNQHLHFGSVCSKILFDHLVGKKTQICYLNCESKRVLIEMALSASSDSVPVDEIKDLLTCSMCSETLNDPRSLPCLHNFCKVCLGEYI